MAINSPIDPSSSVLQFNHHFPTMASPSHRGNICRTQSHRTTMVPHLIYYTKLSRELLQVEPMLFNSNLAATAVNSPRQLLSAPNPIWAFPEPS
jgi:hypothetical protein